MRLEIRNLLARNPASCNDLYNRFRYYIGLRRAKKVFTCREHLLHFDKDCERCVRAFEKWRTEMNKAERAIEKHVDGCWHCYSSIYIAEKE